MADAMKLRGPDGWATWMDGTRRLGFAHRRLAILDPTARSDQPMITPDERYTIVFNGEIYNFHDVRSALEARGHTFHTTGDTEVLLTSYREYGERMVDHLRGMYAFAIWDAKERTLFFGRDPLGIKPLYYSLEQGILRFASQVKTLRAVTQDDRPDPAGQVGFFLWGSVPEPHTLYKAIRALPPGHTMLAKQGSEPVIRRFADVAQALADGAANRIDDPAEVKRILHDALRESVEAHIISDVPVALFLSAGLDSCTIAALLNELPGVQLNALTLGFDHMKDGPLDESAIAREVASQYGIPCHQEYIGRASFSAEHDHLLHAMDQPTIDGVNVYFVSRLAHQAGYKVALSGLGGDELFAGYSSFQEVPKTATRLKPLAGMPALGRGFRWMSAGVLKHFTSPKYAGVLEYGSSIEGAYLLRRSLYMPWELPSVLPVETVREGWKQLEPMARMERQLAPLAGSDSPNADRLRVSTLEMTQYMRNQLLRDADWAGMAHSLEIRVPLMDFRLIQQLAPVLAGSNAPGKMDMALSPLHRLPPAVLDRKKTGFEVPVREWLLEQNGQPRKGAERGLRGWSRHIMETFN